MSCSSATRTGTRGKSRKGTAIVLALVLLSVFSARTQGATATAVTVSSTAVNGATVTVTTATAHGLSANQGFCNHTASSPYCGVVVTATTNSFTFTQSGAVACSSSCGSVVPAKKIIWLTTQTVNGGYQVNYVLWLTTQQPVAISGGTSIWKQAAAEENAAIAAGNFIEIQRNQFFPLNTTLANAQAQMVNDYNAQQSVLASSVQPGQFYGDYFDTGWLE
jgi:hypothetical protein